MGKEEYSHHINQYAVKCVEPENFVESRQVIIFLSCFARRKL